MTWVTYNPDLVESISKRMDLRDPNREALHKVGAHIEPGDGSEWICDLATGVGKTYLAAGLLEYLAESGVRNVVMVVPLDAIYEKTIENFTPGTRKYIPGADFEPVVVTSENFQRMSEALNDPTLLKLYIFKVQSLLAPSDDMRRKLHSGNENIGDPLYKHLQNLDDLVVVADEHHVYSGDAEKYGATIRDLGARAVIGLTATPNTKDVKAQKVIYQYTLAQAIADELVKIPVIVYRSDGMKDEDSQLADACHLREVKEDAWRTYSQSEDKSDIKPVLFVVCEKVDHANKVADKLSTKWLTGDEQVLVITGGSKDAALRALKAVEDPDSPVRAVVSVDKLKEGWDVRNIGVIVSFRPLFSETLTEQVLGRGLRLPFGKRTGVEAVDTVDIVAHDSYQKLLANKKALLQQVVDERTSEATEIPDVPAVIRTGPDGEKVFVSPKETESTQEGFTFVFGGDSGAEDVSVLFKVRNFDKTVEETKQDAQQPEFILPRSDAPRIRFPRLEREARPTQFSLSLVTEQQAKDVGARYLSDESVYLTRVAMTAQRGIDGEIVVGAEFYKEEDASVEKVAVAKSDLVARLLDLNLVASTVSEYEAAQQTVEWFFEGAGVAEGETAEWSSKRARQATKALEVAILNAYELRRTTTTYHFNPVDLPTLPSKQRMPSEVYDRWGTAKFVRHRWYSGWVRSVEPIAAFDAETTEWRLAQILDQAVDHIDWWLRIYTSSDAWIDYDGLKYYADFIAYDKRGVRWLIEGKADSDAEDAKVVAKREAAEKWVEKVNEEGTFGTWRYLFAAETDIKNAHGRWSDLAKSIQPGSAAAGPSA